MMFGKNSRFFILLILVFVIAGCNSGEKDFYSGDSSALTDSTSNFDDEDFEYQERPDTDILQGGGGDSKHDVDYSQDNNNIEDQDSAVPDESFVDDEQNEIYITEPDVSKCEEGVVSDFQKELVLQRLNYIRSLHNLPPVIYEESDDVYTANCSLVIAANKKLSHTPENNWDCFSKDAYTGCNKSNIFIQTGGNPLIFGSEEIVNAFMTDEGVDSLGHRRWFIDPWLAHISFGRVDDTVNKVLGAAVKVINDDEQSIAGSDIEYVAYPYEYYPSELYNDSVMMSFTVVADKLNKWKNGGVDFITAAISIRDPQNKVLKITGMKFDKEGYGVPNNLRWFAESVKPNIKYNVTVTNVLVDNIPKSFSYWFELK